MGDLVAVAIPSTSRRASIPLPGCDSRPTRCRPSQQAPRLDIDKRLSAGCFWPWNQPCARRKAARYSSSPSSVKRGERGVGHRDGLDRLLIVERLFLSVRIPIARFRPARRLRPQPFRDGGRVARSRKANDAFATSRKCFLRPAFGGDEQGVRQHRVGIGHARLEPLPVRPPGALVAFHQPLRRGPGNGSPAVRCPSPPPPTDAPKPESRTPAHAGSAGRRASGRTASINSRANVAVVVRQIAAEHFGQGADRLALAIAAAFRIEPAAVVTRGNCGTRGRADGRTPGSSDRSSPGSTCALRGADPTGECRGARPGRCRRSCSRSRAAGRCRWHAGSARSSRSCDPGDPAAIPS